MTTAEILKKIYDSSTYMGAALFGASPEVTKLVEAVNANRTDESLRAELKKLTARGSFAEERDAAAAIILAAGLFGIVLGVDNHFNYKSGDDNGSVPRVNSFLNAVRLGILNVTALDGNRKSNARTYSFYPEFRTETAISTRVAKIAEAHSDMGETNTELKALYSLGGYFGEATAKTWSRVKLAGGTTCIMTARAIYQASGAQMIGADEKMSIGTPNGSSELGVPTGNKEWKNHLKVWRADLDVNGQGVHYGGFKDTGEARPGFGVGDIYLLSGHGDHTLLDRPATAATPTGTLAPHVGIITNQAGDQYRTVDGGSSNTSGSSSGTYVKLNKKSLVKGNPGWHFEGGQQTKSYSMAEIKRIDDMMATVNIENDLKGRPDVEPFKGRKKTIKMAEDQLAEALAANDQKKADAARTLKNTVLGQHATLVRGEKRATPGLGAIRTIQGWWHPTQYEGLQYVTTKTVQSLLRGA